LPNSLNKKYAKTLWFDPVRSAKLLQIYPCAHGLLYFLLSFAEKKGQVLSDVDSSKEQANPRANNSRW
jgi:hypothetical protein